MGAGEAASAASTKAGVGDVVAVEGEAIEEGLLDEEVRPITPKKPTSAAGKKKSGDGTTAVSTKTKAGTLEGEAGEDELLDEEAPPITPKKSTSVAGKKAGEALEETNKTKITKKKGVETASAEGGQLEEEARPVTPKRPASRTGKKEIEDTPGSLADEKSDIVSKKSGKIATKADDD